MRQETWKELDKLFAEYPFMMAGAVETNKIVDASQTIGVRFPKDYISFVEKYGGAIVGSKSVIGLKGADPMGSIEQSVIEATNHFRSENWPGVDNWAIFSIDHAGNPYGFDYAGRVWLSDHDFGEIVCIADSFESFLRKECLELDD